MDMKKMLELAGIYEAEVSTMTKEAEKDVKKAVSHYYDRLLTDKVGDVEARKMLNALLKSLM